MKCLFVVLSLILCTKMLGVSKNEINIRKYWENIIFRMYVQLSNKTAVRL